MNKKYLTGTLILALAAIMAVPAQARPGRGFGRPHSHVGVGIGFGFGYLAGSYPYHAPYYPPVYGYPYGYPYTYSPYGYYPPTIVIPAQPPVYIEQSPPVEQSPQAGTAAVGSWYFCRNPEGYYPYVKECPAGWQAVAATPPPADSR